jgi:hypothetical protein
MEAERLYNATSLSLMGYNPTPQSNRNRCPQFRKNSRRRTAINTGGVRARTLQKLRDMAFIDSELNLGATDIILNSEKGPNRR